jgi:hypothetical protein
MSFEAMDKRMEDIKSQLAEGSHDSDEPGTIEGQRVKEGIERDVKNMFRKGARGTTSDILNERRENLN